ncbi:MAG: DUF423 domain-containing protein [Deltaproteobacteria bacterium]|nr:DUF423 domain-containing protein [Deltaproteobacteria bacterium]
MAKCFLIVGSVFGFLSVALGAFGAHALKQKFNDYQMGIFQTGVQYQFFHTLALFLVGVLFLKSPEVSLLKYAGYAFTFGIVIFSGSLYLLAATQVKVLGAITPIGGVSFLIGWAILGVAVYKFL